MGQIFALTKRLYDAEGLVDKLFIFKDQSAGASSTTPTAEMSSTTPITDTPPKLKSKRLPDALMYAGRRKDPG